MKIVVLLFSLIFSTYTAMNIVAQSKSRLAIPCKYTYCRDFSESLAMVAQGDQIAYINKDGVEMIPFEKGFIGDGYDFHCGLAIARTKYWKGYIDKSGNKKFTNETAGDFSEGLANFDAGYIDTSGSVVISSNGRWKKGYPFRNGCARIYNGSGYGYINKDGNIIIDCQFQLEGDFSDGVAWVKNDNSNWGIIGTDGKMITPFQYSSTSDFSEELSLVENSTGRCFIDNSGSTVFTVSDFSLMGVYSDGLVPVKSDRGYAYMRKDGSIAFWLPENVKGGHNFHEGFAQVQKEGKYALIDKTGKIVTAFEYDEIRDVWEGMAAVKKGNLWGYLAVEDGSSPNDTSAKVALTSLETKTRSEYASYPGGSDALSQLISRNLIYPATAQENGIQGHVVIGCIVEADGTVSGYEVIRSVEPSLDREALRVAHLIRKLNPATENGKPVRAKYYIPFGFKL